MVITSENILSEYQNYLIKQSYAKTTWREYVFYADRFLKHLKSVGVKTFTQLSYAFIMDYCRGLKGDRLRRGTTAVKRFLVFLYHCHYVKVNLAEDIEAPSLNKPYIKIGRPKSYSPTTSTLTEIPSKELLLHQYGEYLQSMGKSKRTVEEYPHYVHWFLSFLESSGISDVRDMKTEHLQNYHRDLLEYTYNGKPLHVKTVRSRLQQVKSFVRFLYKSGKIYIDPGFGMEMPRVPKSLPRNILEVWEVKAFFGVIDTASLLGKRNLAIIELLYGCGLRSSELCELKLHQLSLKASELHFRGKGNKEAIIPFGEAASVAIGVYLSECRPFLLDSLRGGPKGQTVSGLEYVFVSKNGKRLTPGNLFKMVVCYAKKAGIEKTVGAHSFRHSCATHLLKNGADIRLIQRLLRHEDLSSTQIYTRVEVGDLAEAQKKYHPRELSYQKIKEYHNDDGA